MVSSIPIMSSNLQPDHQGLLYSRIYPNSISYKLPHKLTPMQSKWSTIESIRISLLVIPPQVLLSMALTSTIMPLSFFSFFLSQRFSTQGMYHHYLWSFKRIFKDMAQTSGYLQNSIGKFIKGVKTNDSQTLIKSFKKCLSFQHLN